MKQKNRLRVKYSGNLRLHWGWSVALALTILILDIILLLQDRRSGIIAFVFTAFYFVAVLVIYLCYRPRILSELVDFATHYGQVQKEILQEFEIPAALLEPDGRVLWMNERMCELTDRRSNYRKNISSLFPEITSAALPVAGWSRDVRMTWNELDFRAHIQRISMDSLIDEAMMVEKEKEGDTNFLFMLYLFDETELNRSIRENREQRPVIGLAYLDNYEEVMEQTPEIHQALLNVLVERKIGKYFSSVDGLVKKLEKDKYLVVMTQKSLNQLKEDRFSILEGVKNTSIGNEISMTVSIGIGANGKGLVDTYEQARGAIEMALGRGGDQTVIKDQEEMLFFGGKTQHNEKNTRVRSRVKAQALRELMLSRDVVVTMGHQLTDMDSFGAAVGVCRAAKTVGKPAHIVLGELNTNIRGWVEKFRDNKEYDADLFITHEEAINMVDENAAVIVVDTNRPSMTECREILSQTDAVVVLDHHRATRETIENASLSYIEPSASSACEMIAEILQYFEGNVRVKSLEADCIYAGMLIDTNSFVAKTGVRTFEAAAYLRRCGADVTRVRKALRGDFESYKAKAAAVERAETYMGCYAISVCEGKGLANPSVIGAQAANELLNINDMKASFVLTEYNGRIYVSARSIDELNVQLVMERLGGGGHMNIAGAQLTDLTMDEAVQKVKDTLKEMTEEGAI